MYEDGLIRAAAENSECDFIVSRGGRAFLNSPVPRVTAQECLNAIGFSSETLAAMEDAASGRAIGPFDSADDMFASLDED